MGRDDGVVVGGRGRGDNGLNDVVFDEVADEVGGDARGIAEDLIDYSLLEFMRGLAGVAPEIGDAFVNIIVGEFGLDVT